MKETFEIAIATGPEHATLNFEVGPATMSLACHPPGLRDHPSATSKGPPRPLIRAGRL